MAAFTEKHALLIEGTHTAVTKLLTVVLDTNGNKGLCHKVEDIFDSVTDLNKKQNKLSKNFWTLVAFLAGTGLIGGGTFGLVELLKR